jgi:hypothetical protein
LHDLDVVGVGELVHRYRPLQTIPLFAETPHVACARGGIAGDQHYSVRLHRSETSYDLVTQTLAGWVGHQAVYPFGKLISGVLYRSSDHVDPIAQLRDVVSEVTNRG